VARLPFVDTHVHFFDLDDPSLRYSWLERETPWEDLGLGDYRAMRSQRYWADDFLAETRFANVLGAIHVQAATGIEDPVEETRWLQAFADRLGMPQGIIAYADLTDPRIDETLERHAAFANLRGIRDLRYDDYLGNERWLRGYGSLARHGLVACDDPYVEEMALARALADRYPEIVLCIDHASYPRRRDDEYFEAWRHGIRLLAGAPNVVIKISGLGMVDHAWTVESLRPWVDTCIEAFGTQRSFFGTNWPVDRLYSSYPDVLDAYAELISDLTPAEQRAVFSENAQRIFRLDLPEGPRT
jgi:predicted TIM-barrel fold metal-dependent hydrolase